MRHIIIGDIHSCFDELSALIDKICIRNDDQVISVGDLIHKGPFQSETLKLYTSISDYYVLGNHEEKQLRWEKHNRNEKNSGKPNPMKGVDGFIELREHFCFIKNNSKLYATFKSGNKDFLIVHGGIIPRIKSLPDQDPFVHSGRDKEFYFSMLRTRFVNEKGNFVSLGEETEKDYFWADKYDGRFGHAFFGHQPFMQDGPMHFDNATGLDLGCVYGNKLCAAIVEDGEVSYLTVDAREPYWNKD